MIPLGFGGLIAVLGLCVIAIAGYLVYMSYLKYRWLPWFVFGRTRFDTRPFVNMVADAVFAIAPARSRMRDALGKIRGPNQATSLAREAASVVSMTLPGEPPHGDPAFQQTVEYFVTGLDAPAHGAVDDVVETVFKTVFLRRIGGRKRRGAPDSTTIPDDSPLTRSWIIRYADMSMSIVREYARDFGNDTVVQISETPVSEREVRDTVRSLLENDDFLDSVRKAGAAIANAESDWRKFGVAADFVAIATSPSMERPNERVEVREDGRILVHFDASPPAPVPKVTSKMRSAILDAVNASVRTAAGAPQASLVVPYLRTIDRDAQQAVLSNLASGDGKTVEHTGRTYRTNLVSALDTARTQATEMPTGLRTALESISPRPVVTGGVPWSIDRAVHLRLLEVLVDAADAAWVGIASASSATGDAEIAAQTAIGGVFAVLRSEIQLFLAKHTHDDKVEEIHEAFVDLEKDGARRMYRRAFFAAKIFLALGGIANDLVAHATGIDDLCLAAQEYLPDVLRIRRVTAKPTMQDILQAYTSFFQRLIQNWPLSVLRCNAPLLNPRAYYDTHRDAILRASETAIDMLVTFVDVPGNVFRNAVCLKKCA